MVDKQNYGQAVELIKTAILQSQYDAARSVNERQLMLYYGVGKYVSINSRNGFWGKGALESISEQLEKELPGLRGFTSRNLRYMRTFYEEWGMLDSTGKSLIAEDSERSNLELASSKMEIEIKAIKWNLQVPKLKGFPYDAFLHIGFTHHRVILGGSKDYSERLYCIQRCAHEHYTVEELKASIARDDYHHQGSLPNNFLQTLPAAEQALRAVSTFKDEYLLDYINVEELNIRDKQDVDELVGEGLFIFPL